MNKVIYKNFAPRAAENASVTNEDNAFQHTEKFSDERTPVNFASFESLGINLLDPDLCFATESDFSGFISSKISGNDKSFPGGGIKLVISLSGGYFSGPGITLHFYRHICPDISVAVYSGENELFSGEFHPDSLDYFCDAPAEKYNKIIITFITAEIPYQFVKLSGIDFGNTFEITEFFGAINIFEELEPDCTDLPFDTCDFEGTVPSGITPQVGQSFYVYAKSKPFGKFTIERLTEVVDNRYIFESHDDKAILGNNPFPALARGTRTVDELLDMIFEISDISINSEDFGSVLLTGFIQQKNCRYTAAMMSMGGGFFISSARRTKLHLFKARNRKNAVIPADRILGKAEYIKKAPYTSISLYVHGESKFDNETAVKHTAVDTEIMANVASNELTLDKYSLFSDPETRLNEIAAIGFERNEIEAEIILDDEEIGDILSIETEQGLKTGILKSLDIRIQGSEVTARAVFTETEAV